MKQSMTNHTKMFLFCILFISGSYVTVVVKLKKMVAKIGSNYTYLSPNISVIVPFNDVIQKTTDNFNMIACVIIFFYILIDSRWMKTIM